MNIKKSYCKKCKHMVECGSIRNTVYKCNKGIVEKDYFGDYLYHTLCSEKNKNKDCNDFKRRLF